MTIPASIADGCYDFASQEDSRAWTEVNSTKVGDGRRMTVPMAKLADLCAGGATVTMTFGKLEG